MTAAPALRNDRLLRALARQPVDATPVWLMRQAGRYLPEYQAVRAQAGSFLDLCMNPELACEVTVQPLRRFALDAAILFSDILTIPGAMGLGLVFDDQGPHFERPLRGRADIMRLPVPDPEQELGFVLQTVRRVRRELDGAVPLIGFAGAPWTLATYMVEGGGSRDFRRVKGLLYEDPASMQTLLATLADAVTQYLNAQIRAGAQAVMLFDTWGGILTDRDYREFALAAVTRSVSGLERSAEGRAVPVILFTKGGGQWLAEQASAGVDALGLDWTVDLAAARRQVGQQVALQGNLDPAVLAAPPARLQAEVARVLAAWGDGPGHVFNLGHGVTPDIDPAQVALLVDSVHTLSARKP
ncbi:MAG TPA: uroporphyrinogen decarboxylase [Acidiferrobacteraceae bacterium]|nr:uroporphyrinogen decarboxylase [Acidiferrobacteraceae bacterium]